MKTHKFFLAFLATGSLIAAPSAFAAATKLTDACKDDITKFNCTATTEDQVHECLEKNEKKGDKTEGFSTPCYKAHVAYEKHNRGKEEKK